MANENCYVIAQNTGLSCIPTMKAAKKFIFVPTFNNAGVRNEIDLTVPLTESYFTARVNAVDPSERWYPTPEIKNVEDMRGDPTMDASEDGEKYFVEDTVRGVVGFFFASKASPQLVGILNSLRGGSWSVFAVDTDFNLIGKVGSTSTTFAPIKINGDTIWCGLIKATNKLINKAKLMFDVSTSEDDADLTMITADQMSYNLSDLEGLIDVTSVVTSITTTGFVATLTAKGGTPLEPILAEGLVIADFVSSVTSTASRIRNTTNGSDITIVSVTEAPAGVYTFAFVAQTSGDILVLKPVKSGYDFAAVEAATIEIP